MNFSPFAVAAIVFLAALTQSLSGFGSGLVCMAFLPPLIGLRAAAPLVALLGTVLETTLLIRFRSNLSIRDVWLVILASFVSVPFGVYLLDVLDERIAMIALGLILAGYATYSLLGRHLPRLTQRTWAVLAGLLGGILGGAYNTAGPPVILYADTQGWEPQRFKSNLQGYFITNTLQVLFSHALAGNYTADIFRLFWPALPGLALGLVFGAILDRFISPHIFRKVVLGLLVVMGLRLMW